MVKREFSAGAVIFRRSAGKYLYLLLHYHFKADYWGFPRGNIEKGESAEQAARREISEETGLKDVEFIPGFKERASWFYKWKGQNVFKQTTYFLAKTREKGVKISKEHLGFKWLEFEEAVKALTYKNAKEILKKAEEFLQRRKNKGIKRFVNHSN